MTSSFDKLLSAAAEYVKSSADIGGHVSEPETLNTVRKNIFDFMKDQPYVGNFAPVHEKDLALVNLDNLLKSALSKQKVVVASGAGVDKQITAVQKALVNANLKYYLNTTYERRNDRADMFLLVILVIVLAVLIIINLPAAAVFVGGFISSQSASQGVLPSFAMGVNGGDDTITDDLDIKNSENKNENDNKTNNETDNETYIDGDKLMENDADKIGGACHKCASKCGGPICSRCAQITLGGCGSCSNNE